MQRFTGVELEPFGTDQLLKRCVPCTAAAAETTGFFAKHTSHVLLSFLDDIYP